MSKVSTPNEQKKMVTPILLGLAVLGCIGLAVSGYYLAFLFVTLFTMLVAGIPIAIALPARVCCLCLFPGGYRILPLHTA